MREPKQKRSQRTLAKILAAAVELFESRGVDATGIADVAKHAGSSVGSLYGRFEGKLDLVQAVDRLLWERVTARWVGSDLSGAGGDGAGRRGSETERLLARVSETLAPEHQARASITEFLNREGADSTGPPVLRLLVSEVQEILAEELTPGQTPEHAPDVLRLLARIAVDEANAGRGSDVDATSDEIARLSVGDSLSESVSDSGADETESRGHLAYVIEATLSELRGGQRTPKPEPDRSAPAVDPFDIWA